MDIEKNTFEYLIHTLPVKTTGFNEGPRTNWGGFWEKSPTSWGLTFETSNTLFLNSE